MLSEKIRRRNKLKPEQLKEKKIEEYKTDLLQTEQKELDEIGLQIFKRKCKVTI